MWNRSKRRRLDWLRARDAQGILSQPDRKEMEALFAELDAEEAAALRPAFERMQQREDQLLSEKEQLAVQSADLQRIVAEHEKLLAEAHSYLDELRARRAALADEFRRVTGHELTSSH